MTESTLYGDSFNDFCYWFESVRTSNTAVWMMTQFSKIQAKVSWILYYLSCYYWNKCASLGLFYIQTQHLALQNVRLKCSGCRINLWFMFWYWLKLHRLQSTLDCVLYSFANEGLKRSPSQWKETCSLISNEHCQINMLFRECKKEFARTMFE